MKHAALIISFALAGCASSPAPPAADAPQRPFPDVGGQSVMLLPVQRVVPAVSAPATADTTRPALALSTESLRALETELAYWLPEHARRARWVLPDTIERALRRNPTLEVSVRDLPVHDFQRSRLESIGDPLYGDLRRVAVLTDARLALLPLGAVWIPEIGGTGRVHIAAALIDTMGGAVLWHGVVAGSAGDHDAREVIASAARALAVRVPR